MKRGFLKIFLAMICLLSSVGLFALGDPICICGSVPDSPDADTSYIRVTNYNYRVGGGTATGDDGASVRAIRLPFKFYLFGHRIDSFYVNINGSISDIQVGQFHTTDFANYDEKTRDVPPVPSKFMIAPYWSDIHISNIKPNTGGKHECGDIYYKYLVKNVNDTVGIKILWHEVGFYYYSGSYNNSSSCEFSDDINRKTTFELILTNGDGSFLPMGKNIAFCYKKIGFAIGSQSENTGLPGEGSSYKTEFGYRHDGTPATVGIVYKEGERPLYFQVGRFDRPGNSIGSRREDNFQVKYAIGQDGGKTEYSGIDWLLEQSGNCALVYGLDSLYTLDAKNVCNGNGTYTVTAFGPSLPEEVDINEDEPLDFPFDVKKYTVKIDGVESYDIPFENIYSHNFFQYEFELPTDGESHTVSLWWGNELLCEKNFQSPQCGCGEGSSLEIDGITVDQSITVCQGLPIHIKHKSRRGLVNPRYVWSFNDMVIGQGGEMSSRIESFTAPRSGRLAVNIESDDCKESVNMEVNLNVNLCNPDECNECPSLFAPQAGEKYFVSGWVKDENQVGVDSFENVYLQVAFKLMGDDNLQKINCYPEGNIIDGWQRISGSFTIPARAENMSINLKNDTSSNEVYFDDIRFHPFNASMKSYVYDPKTLRLAAELDEENYATFYEYDEEGALVRIKKETERGVMTIREARQSKPKK
jgi:hypothetical protein